jgi:hypothetical protein
VTPEANCFYLWIVVLHCDIATTGGFSSKPAGGRTKMTLAR